MTRRGLFFVLVALGLGPVWGFRYFPTQDGPSHLLSARVFKVCVDPAAPESEFFERRLSAIPNWTAAALLGALTEGLPPRAAEKVLISLYVVGLPLALDYFLAGVGASGASALGLLFVWNSCLFRGFYSYGLGLVLLFLVLGWFVRRTDDLSARDTAWLSVLLLASYFSHLASFLITVFCLLWLAATGPAPGPAARLRRILAVALATAPVAILTFQYLQSTGFFGTPAVSSALSIAEEEARGTLARVAETPADLYRELFTAHGGVFVLGFAMLAMSVWFWDAGDEGTFDSAPWRWPMFTLSSTLLLFFILIPDTLRAHGGYLKGRLAPVSLLVALGAIRSAPRGRVGLRHAVALALIVANLGLVIRHVARMNREIEEFTAGVAWVRAGETLVSIKAEPGPTSVIDLFSSDYYCIATNAVCLSSYQGGTQHFPVSFRRGITHRIRKNLPGSFWADVVLAWGVPEDRAPLPDEPYSEVFRRGRLRLFRRLRAEPRNLGPLPPH